MIRMHRAERTRTAFSCMRFRGGSNWLRGRHVPIWIARSVESSSIEHSYRVRMRARVTEAAGHRLEQGVAATAWLNLPNAISLTRIPLACAFVFADRTLLRLGIVGAAALSDWMDGALARRTGRTSRTGERLDPIADRTFMVAALVRLVIDGSVPLWALPLLLLRDIGVVFGALIVMMIDPSARMPARTMGKRLTWLQFAAVALLLVRPGWLAVAIVPITIMGLIALVDYARHMRRTLLTG
jgi:phosphatidylglycerophosphate synthase